MTRNDTNRDDLETVVETLRERRYTESAEIAEAGGNYRNGERVRYYDTRENMVAPGALRYLQEQGFEIEQAGAHYRKEVDEQRGWMEAGR